MIMMTESQLTQRMEVDMKRIMKSVLMVCLVCLMTGIFIGCAGKALLRVSVM